jgi:AraC family transcriptional regulator
MESTAPTRILVNDLKKGVERPLTKTSPLRSSGAMGFRGFLLERHQLAELENLDVAGTQTLLGLHLSRPIKVEIRDEGPFRERIISPGDIVVLPAGVPHSCRVKGDVEFMVIGLEAELLTRAARAVTERDEIDLKLNWGFRDSFIRETFASLGAVCEGGKATDRVYAESLANSLAMHLARNCQQMNGLSAGATRGLSRLQLGRVMNFIHTTPYAGISLQAMADAAGLSPFHFSRMFKVSTGSSPHQYVLRRRIDVGAEMLLNQEHSISDVALELGFADQSHFTMHFKRVHGMGPAGYRRQHRR